MPKEFQLWEEGVSKKVKLWGIVGELANINLIMGGEGKRYHSIWAYEEEKSYNY